jgi:hypothetical protein
MSKIYRREWKFIWVKLRNEQFLWIQLQVKFSQLSTSTWFSGAWDWRGCHLVNIFQKWSGSHPRESSREVNGEDWPVHFYFYTCAIAENAGFSKHLGTKIHKQREAQENMSVFSSTDLQHGTDYRRCSLILRQRKLLPCGFDSWVQDTALWNRVNEVYVLRGGLGAALPNMEPLATGGPWDVTSLNGDGLQV